jgi:hypothetical protein
MSPFTVKVKNPENGSLNEVKIVEFTPSKGRGKDNPKLQPEGFTNWSLSQYVNLFGEKQVLESFVKPRFKQLLANMTSEATIKDDGETPETDENVIRAEFGEYLQALSPRGETISSLNARLAEIFDEELPAALDAGDLELATRLNNEQKEIKKSIASKKRKEPTTSTPVAVAA